MFPKVVIWATKSGFRVRGECSAAATCARDFEVGGVAIWIAGYIHQQLVSHLESLQRNSLAIKDIAESISARSALPALVADFTSVDRVRKRLGLRSLADSDEPSSPHEHQRVQSEDHSVSRISE